MMILRDFFRLEKSLNLEIQIRPSIFKEEFSRRYSSDKKTEFEGILDKDFFKLWNAKGYFKTTNNSELHGTILKKENNTVIKGKVVITPEITLMFVIGLIALPLIFAYLVYSGEFEFRMLGILVLMILGILAVINIQLFYDKREYINELKSFKN